MCGESLFSQSLEHDIDVELKKKTPSETIQYCLTKNLGTMAHPSWHSGGLCKHITDVMVFVCVEVLSVFPVKVNSYESWSHLGGFSLYCMASSLGIETGDVKQGLMKM